jgi:hypothetical protein
VPPAVDLDPAIPAELMWSAADETLHEVLSDRPDWTETTWFSFNVPERNLAGWLYVQMRPNIGQVAGGAFAYDPSGSQAWEVPYFAYSHYQPMPDPLDLKNVSFANGVAVRCLEPGMRYALHYQFRDQEDFVADLEFQGLTPPIPLLPGEPPFVGSSHYDQTGRVTGTLLLQGETISVDCFAVRDRSWGRRPELLGRRSGDRVSYAFGTAAEDEAFLVFAAPDPKDPTADVEHLTGGWLLRDGELRRLSHAERRVTRDYATGFVQRLEIVGVDSAGRDLQVHGEARSRLALQTSHVCVNSFMEWHINGRHGYGEDQDVWSYARFAQWRRQR